MKATKMLIVQVNTCVTSTKPYGRITIMALELLTHNACIKYGFSWLDYKLLRQPMRMYRRRNTAENSHALAPEVDWMS